MIARFPSEAGVTDAVVLPPTFESSSARNGFRNGMLSVSVVDGIGFGLFELLVMVTVLGICFCGLGWPRLGMDDHHRASRS